MDPLDRELIELRKRIAAKATGIAPQPQPGESAARFYGRALGRYEQPSPALAEVRGRDAESGTGHHRIAAPPPPRAPDPAARPTVHASLLAAGGRTLHRPARRRPRYRLFVVGIVLGGLGAGAAAWLGGGTGVAAGSQEDAAPPPSAAEEAERDSLIREIRALEALRVDDQTPRR